MLLEIISRKPLETIGCINDTRATQAKYLGLQNNINRLYKSSNETGDEILAILEPENIESSVSERKVWELWNLCMRFWTK